jgi:putative PIN family toxin of toxin-antitoxin system
MSRVVLDTNVYISALLFGGLPGSVLDLAILGAFTLILSPALLDELDEKLRAKFEMTMEDTAFLRARLETVGEIVEPGEVLKVIVDDPDDNRVLECAVKGKADLIVSGDRHLLKLGMYRGIKIVTVRQFMESVEGSPNE